MAGRSDNDGRKSGTGRERSGSRAICRFAFKTRSERVVRRCAGPGRRAAAVHRRERREPAAQARVGREKSQPGTRSAEEPKTTISKRQRIFLQVH